MYQWNKKYSIAVLLLCLSGLSGLTGCTSKEELVVLSRTEQPAEAKTDEQTVEVVPVEEMPAEEKALLQGNNPVQNSGSESLTTDAGSGWDTPATQQKIYVHVCGAVENPGVYALPGGTRIFEAVEAAGGFSGDADSDYVNQAEVLADGMKIQIPTKTQTAEWIAAGDILMQREVVTLAQVEAENPTTLDTMQQKVNINLADENDLCTITGIGQGRAKAIIAYREQNGGFATIEDIMKVDGIKQATFEKIKEQICVK